MNRIDELIAKHCPKGVAYKAFGDIGTITRGKRFVKSDIVEVGTPCMHYGELYTKYRTWAIKNYSYLEPELASRLRLARPGDVIIVSAGETIEDIGKSVAWLGGENVVIHDALYAFSSPLDPMYVVYFTQTDNFHDQIRRYISSAKISAVSTKNLGKIRIPTPPLEVQREIVKILDTFTKLEAELEAELEARKKQYEYYYSELLQVDQTVQQEVLSKVVEFRNGKGHEKQIDVNGEYVVVNSKFISTSGKVRKYSATQIAPVFKDDILMVMSDLPSGKALAKCFYVDNDNKYTLNQRICALSIRDTHEINPKYFYYVLNRNRQLLQYDNGVDQTNLRKGDILKILIPTPPLAEQIRIVTILDKFDALVNDLTSGLPAEIKARRQQYEYYRDRLLSFKEAA